MPRAKNSVKITYAPVRVSKWEENGIFYVYSKSLGITGHGNCKIEADRSFRIQLLEIVKYQRDKQ